MQRAKTRCTSSEEAVVVDERRQQQGRQEALVLRQKRPWASEKVRKTPVKSGCFPVIFNAEQDSKQQKVIGVS